MNLNSSIGIALLIIGFCLITRRTIRCFFSRGYVDQVIEILLVLFGIIAFMFGLDANVLSEHHRERERDNNHYWFNPSNIFTFPIEQLSKYNFTDTINNTLNNKDTLNYIFVIDKTLSNKIQKEDIWVKYVKDSITGILKKNGCDNYKLDDLNTHEDVLLMSVMRHLFANSNYRVNYTIMLYNGLNPKDKTSDSFEKMFISGDFKGGNNYCDFFNSYHEKIDSLKSDSLKIKPKERETDFVRIFETLKHPTICIPNHRNVIVIFSDFLHEKDNWKLLEKNIKNVVEIKDKKEEYKYVKLFALENENASDENKKNRILRTKSLINDNRPYVYLYEFKQGEIFNDLVESSVEDMDIYMASIAQVSSVFPIDTLNFYYPFSHNKFVETNRDSIMFKRSGRYVLNIRNESSEDKILIQLESDTDKMILKNNYNDIKYINSSKKYTANLQTLNIHKDVYLEISNKDGMGRVLISFKELIPKTICYILIFAHTMIILLLFSCFAFFFMKLYYCITKGYNFSKYKYLKWILGIICIVIPLIILVLVVNFCQKAVSRIPSFIEPWWVLVILFFCVLIILLYQETQHLKQKCLKCLNHRM